MFTFRSGKKIAVLNSKLIYYFAVWGFTCKLRRTDCDVAATIPLSQASCPHSVYNLTSLREQKGVVFLFEPALVKCIMKLNMVVCSFSKSRAGASVSKSCNLAGHHIPQKLTTSQWLISLSCNCVNVKYLILK